MTVPEPSARRDPYVRAARFAGERPAGQAYFALQQGIFTAALNDLSAYRFQLDGLYHVAVVRVRPAPVLEERLTAIIMAGELTELPAAVQQALFARRAQVAPHQTWWEGHYRPGRRL